MFTETQPIGRKGTPVKPDSADPGLPPSFAVIPLDEDHLSMVKPDSKSADIYRYLRDFVKRPPAQEAPGLVLQQTFESMKTDLSSGFQRIESIAKASNVLTQSLPILDDAARKQIERLRKARHSPEFDSIKEARRLAIELEEGALSGASNIVRAVGLAWCARVLSVKAPSEEVQRLIDQSLALAMTQEATFARAFLLVAIGKKADALRELDGLQSPAALSAKFFVASRNLNPEEVLNWFAATNWKYGDLDAEGRLHALAILLQRQSWPEALALADSLSEQDFVDAPQLLRQAASAHMVQILPDELKSNVLRFAPFYSPRMLLQSDAFGLEQLRKAKNLYDRSAAVATEFGCRIEAQDASDTALFLSLRDPDEGENVLALIAEKLSIADESLHYVPVALQLSIPLDIERVKIEIARQKVMRVEASRDVVLAEFAIAPYAMTANEYAAYLAANRDVLVSYMDPNVFGGHRIEALISSDQIPEAEAVLEAMRKSGLPKPKYEYWSDIIRIAEAKENPASYLESRYRADKSVENLIQLVETLVAQEDWPRVANYGRTLFDKSKDLTVALYYINALSVTHRDQELIDFSRSSPEIFESADSPRASLGWALYRQGDLRSAKEILQTLRLERDVADDRNLFFNIHICSGEWDALVAFTEQQWEKREERSARELLMMGRLAHQLNAPRRKELVKEAARKALDDPGILLACYETASNGDWEDDPDVGVWLATAADLSGEDGPLKRVSMQEIFDLAPQWQERQAKAWELLSSGNAPALLTAQLLNRTTVDLTLVRALENTHEKDVRKRALIPAFSGSRPGLVPHVRTLVIEATSALVFVYTGLLSKVIEHFERIHIPHSFMRWLFEESQKLGFHQPSRVVQAKWLKSLLDDRQLERFDVLRPGEISMVREVGESLASLIKAAESASEEEGRQHLVVRPYPIHKVGSLTGENADLQGHEATICSCSAVVKALRLLGQLTAREETRALNYLSFHEEQIPSELTIAPNAVLYLDQLATVFLCQAKVIDRLKAAGLTAYVDPIGLEEMESLLGYEAISAETEKKVAELRIVLRDAISSGKVQIAPYQQTNENEAITDHPTTAILKIASRADAAVVDDRFINRLQNIEHEKHLTPIVTSIDIMNQMVAEDVLSDEDRLEAITRLRQANFCFVPVSVQEAEKCLSGLSLVDGRVLESIELRALRENIQSVRMGLMLQIPEEDPWFGTLVNAFISAMEGVWSESIADDVSRVRSAWVLDLLDVRFWAHLMPERADAEIALQRYRQQLLSLLFAVGGLPLAVRRRFLAFLDDRVFEGVRDTDSEMFDAILASVRAMFQDLARGSASGEVEQ
ncbi:hypothetical protein [Rhizobium sp. NXC24]|uniref:HTH domain-containing protein n=1 Tax=Rhizobium sp. NXC24 TaxID=2048897 RepID=UPI000CF1DA5A|nr:hypothetical protein [Rhizobium sp. NXC24]